MLDWKWKALNTVDKECRNTTRAINLQRRRTSRLDQSSDSKRTCRFRNKRRSDTWNLVVKSQIQNKIQHLQLYNVNLKLRLYLFKYTRLQRDNEVFRQRVRQCFVAETQLLECYVDLNLQPPWAAMRGGATVYKQKHLTRSSSLENPEQYELSSFVPRNPQKCVLSRPNVQYHKIFKIKPPKVL